MSGDARRRGFPWRGLLATAAVLVLVRWQVLQTMTVPSDSMQPFLNGDPEHGDRVAVLKNAFRWSPPGRFDPVVFEREGDGEVQYLVKRVAALGGESVQIRGGDLYVGRDTGDGLPLLCKSFAELMRVRVLLHDEPMDAGFAERFDVCAGVAEPVVGGWHFSGDGEAGERLDCRFLTAPRSGYLERDGTVVIGREVVADVMLEVTLVPETDRSALVVQLREGMDRFRFYLHGPGPDEIAIDQLRADGEVVALRSLATPRSGRPGGFPVGVPLTVAVWNVDESLGVAVNGVEVLATAHTAVAQVALQLREGPTFGVCGGPALVQGVRLYRDLYYTSPEGNGPDQWSVPPGHVFVLGDHSEASIDSRHFGPVPLDDLVGRPIAVCWPPERWRRLP